MKKKPIDQMLEWCDENINYRSRSTKSQQEKEIFIRVKNKLKELFKINP